MNEIIRELELQIQAKEDQLWDAEVAVSRINEELEDLYVELEMAEARAEEEE